jgi:hypothetical protein
VNLLVPFLLPFFCLGTFLARFWTLLVSLSSSLLNFRIVSEEEAAAEDKKDEKSKQTVTIRRR